MYINISLQLCSVPNFLLLPMEKSHTVLASLAPLIMVPLPPSRAMKVSSWRAIVRGCVREMGSILWVLGVDHWQLAQVCITFILLSVCIVALHSVCKMDWYVWSRTMTPFTAIMCPSLLPPANGDINYSGSGFGYLTMANYVCNIGYRLVGDRSSTCVGSSSGSGEWTRPEPTCLRKSSSLMLGCIITLLLTGIWYDVMLPWIEHVSRHV